MNLIWVEVALGPFLEAWEDPITIPPLLLHSFIGSPTPETLAIAVTKALAGLLATTSSEWQATTRVNKTEGEVALMWVGY